ncbi:MAG TPA: DUF4838 domain-containing protein [bacterium]|nr:DUF4838 domain-containing protein [bacterium]HXK93162.1 DUF4838 domain-containing protein [bacterium]
MIHLSKFLVLLTIGIPTLTVFSDVPTYRNEPSGEFMREWLLCGPFPNPEAAYDKMDRERSGFYTDFLQAHGGEAALQIEAGRTVTHDGIPVQWIEFQAEGHTIDLDRAISRDPFVLAYAYCEMESAKATPCLLAFGSNDGARIWLNGEEILDKPVRRGLREDEDIIPVVLRSGKNTLLVKVAETENLWRFCCRLLPFDSGIWNNPRQFFQIVTNRDGQAVLRFVGSASLAGEVLKDVDLEAYPTDEPDRAVWRKRWPGDRETPIGITSPAYGDYTLRVSLTTHEGQQHAFVIPFPAGKRIDYALFQNGRTDYAIVVDEGASESEKWAAKELQHWLKEISGAEFPLRNAAVADDPRAIVLGYNPQSRPWLGNEYPEPDRMDESFTYKNYGPTIVIWGGRERGTMYGVMSFLEREFGCRWYTPAVSVIPKRDTYTFHYLKHSETPGIAVRNDFYFEAFEPLWAARNRVNGAMSYREQPGGLECYWAVHTFFPLVPPKEFYAEHPEYYSLIDGKRVHEHAQLCLTNPDVLRIVVERIMRIMRENPQYRIYCVSQNDWAGPCQCDACQAIAQREESESGPVVWFVNQVAEAVEKEFPDKYIGTLAYQYTRKPCKTIKPRHNVVIRLCSIECCFSHDFLNCPENESFVKDIQGWAAIAPHLYIWDYVVNFSHYILPYPNFKVLQPNLQFFRDHNAIGVMEQAAYQSRGGEFAELRAYLLAKLLWNPDCNVPDVIDDFLHGYYGRSGQYIRAYFDLLHNQVTPERHIHLGLRPDDPLFTEDFIQAADEIFDRAETVADNTDILRRVEMARLPLMYLKCKRFPNQSVRDMTYQRFCEITEREGVTHYAESGQPHREAFHNAMEAEREK